MKSDKLPYIIYVDIECLIRKIDECGNNPEKSSTTNLKSNVSNEVPVVFHNGSNYDYHFIIKKISK